MQIGQPTPVLPTHLADKATVPADPASKTVQLQAAAKPPPFDPNPALRPTLQDRIDVNRTLRLLRQV